LIRSTRRLRNNGKRNRIEGSQHHVTSLLTGHVILKRSSFRTIRG
jgi:hypothetical protein